jgi:two-component system response regulator AdeR
VKNLLEGRKILIAEDEPALADVLRAYMAKEGAIVRVAPDGRIASEEAHRWRPDLILLDIRMPNKDGLSVLVSERESDAGTPIILISALGDDIDRLAGFRLGADDYIVKPFNPLEVVARAAAVLRRQEGAKQLASTPPIVHGGLRIEVESRRAFANDKLINLTPTEFRLLTTMARRPGRMFTRAELGDAVLSEVAADRGVDAHISRLRAKIAIVDSVRIVAIRGEGYRLDIE